MACARASCHVRSCVFGHASVGRERPGIGRGQDGLRRRRASTIRSSFARKRSLREGRSSELSTGRARNRGPSRRARKIRRGSRGDRDAHSDVPHLPVRPPSPRAPRLRTGTPRRRSGHRLRRNGPTRPCPSSRSWRSATRSRAEPSRRRVSDPVGSEERAKRPTTLSAGRVCAALRTVTARQTLPKIFRRRCCLGKTKTWRAFRGQWRDVRLRGCRAHTSKPEPSRSSHRSSRTPVRVDSRSPRHDHAHLHARGGTSRASADAPARRSPHPTGARNQSYPKAEMPTARVPCRKRLPAVHAGPIEMKRVSRARACHSDHHEIRRRTLSRRDLRARPRCHATRADPSSRTMMMMRPEIRRNSVHLFLAFVRSRRTAPRTTAGCLSTATCTISRA